MPVTLDGRYPLQAPRRSRRALIVVAIALVVVVSFASTLLSEWVDLLWFGSLGYSAVFWTTRLWQAGLFVGTALLTFALLYAAFRGLMRAHHFDLPETQALVLSGQTVHLPV